MVLGLAEAATPKPNLEEVDGQTLIAYLRQRTHFHARGDGLGSSQQAALPGGVPGRSGHSHTLALEIGRKLGAAGRRSPYGLRPVSGIFSLLTILMRLLIVGSMNVCR